MSNLLNDLWVEAEKKKDTYKIWGKIYHWLDCDNLGAIILDNKVFWFELNPSSIMPDYIYNYLVKWGERKGFKYLYKIKII